MVASVRAASVVRRALVARRKSLHRNTAALLIPNQIRAFHPCNPFRLRHEFTGSLPSYIENLAYDNVRSRTQGEPRGENPSVILAGERYH